MKMCLCCKRNEIKPRFSFYCRWCYIYLQQSYGLDDTDYITYFKTMYNKKVIEKDCSYNICLKFITITNTVYILMINHWQSC